MVGGLGGAAALTVVHESVRRWRHDAPRSDVLGMQVIERGMRAASLRPPRGQALYGVAMAGDLASNAAYYSLVGRSYPRAVMLGLAAGLGAVLLPGPLGLERRATRRTGATIAMTIGWYLLGAVVAAAVNRRMSADAD